VRLFGVCFFLAALAATLGAQSTRPQPFTRFTPGTLAQDIVVTPKGGWTYMVGSTTDPNYPVTPDAFDRTCGTDGNCNVFQGRFGPQRLADVVLTVFDAAGEMQYSTFLGGSGQDDNPRAALTSDGTLWLAGNKSSAEFEHVPTGCSGELWVARFEYTLRRIDHFMCTPGPTLSDVALDTDGTLWVLGTSGVPVVTRNVFQPIPAGQLDIFVGSFPSSGARGMSTLIGGDRLDAGSKLAITPAGDIAIVGRSNSTNFPLVRALKTSPPGLVVHGDAVMLVLDRSFQFLEFSTYWGGVFDDSATGVAVDDAGNLFVTGYSRSPDMPATTGAFDRQCDADGRCTFMDAFVVKLNPLGELMAATFLGGSELDTANDIAVRPNGQVLVLGMTQSPDFPLVGGQLFQRWKPTINFEHTWLATLDDRLQRVTRSVFVGGEDFLPNVARMIDRNGLAYVTGQVTERTGAPSFGTYLAALPVP
jgi:hypothetical protein